MKFKPISFATGIMLLLFLSACSRADYGTQIPAGALAGELVLSACQYKTEDQSYQADCGTLVVAEDPAEPQGRLLALPVQVIHAATDEPAEPIFFLGGGPGTSAMGYAPPAALLENHDVVLIGYRGADGSTVLNCPEVNQALKGTGSNSLSEAALDAIQSATAACAERIQAAGIDLSHYTMLEVIEDLELARQALGYPQINLLSESYGTRLAQLYARLYPESLLRMVLIGVNPPGHFMFDPQVSDELITEHADLCAQDSFCRSRTDDLAASMQQVLEKLPQRWLFIPINPGKVRTMSFVMLYHRDTSALVFDAYLSAAEGDPSGLALMSLMHDLMIPRAFIWGDLLAKGGTDFDPGRNYRAEMVPPGSILGSPVSLIIWGTAPGAWPIQMIPAELRRVEPIAVQTLLISGNLDFATPLRFASEELMPYLSNGTHVILAEMGHTQDLNQAQAEATQQLLTTFFNTGSVDDSLFNYQPMDYQVSPGFPTLAKLGLGAAILILVLIGALVWFLFYRARRHNQLR